MVYINTIEGQSTKAKPTSKHEYCWHLLSFRYVVGLHFSGYVDNMIKICTCIYKFRLHWSRVLIDPNQTSGVAVGVFNSFSSSFSVKAAKMGIARGPFHDRFRSPLLKSSENCFCADIDSIEPIMSEIMHVPRQLSCSDRYTVLT